jgi:hypothetical protein
MTKIKRNIFIILLLLLPASGICQEKNNSEQIKNKNVSELITEIEDKIKASHQMILNKMAEIEREVNKKIDNIITQHSILHKEIKRIFESQNTLEELLITKDKLLNEKIDSLNTDHRNLVADFNDLNNNTNKKMITIKKDISSKIILASSAILFLFLITITIAIFFQKKFKKLNVLEETIKLDAKFSEILENQLVLMNKESTQKEVPKTVEDIDHSLPIRVGYEIYRMRKRIENMDENMTGLNALKNALTRLEDEFNRQGYSINDLTGQSYVDGLTVKVVNAIERKDLKSGTQIISKMITPQIYYKGLVVDHGEVELAVSAKKEM